MKSVHEMSPLKFCFSVTILLSIYCVKKTDFLYLGHFLPVYFCYILSLHLSSVKDLPYAFFVYLNMLEMCHVSFSLFVEDVITTVNAVYCQRCLVVC